jgi:glycosyltransferase involved in cell wall biosynthesis
MQTRVNSFRHPSAFFRSLSQLVAQWVGLIRAHRRTPPYDVLLVGYPSHADVLPATLLARLRRRPVVMDAFLGLYDTVVEDRQLVGAGRPLAALVRLWERTALHLADRIMVDTQENAQMLVRSYQLPPERVFAVPAGIDESTWQPTPLPVDTSPFRVAFWGTFIPLHGVETLAQAAQILREKNESIEIEVIGTGQTAEHFAALVGALHLDNIVWRPDVVPIQEVARLAERSHCCLGVLGTTAKAGRVVPYKVHEALAAGRPVITADTDAIRRVLVDGKSALLVPAGNAPALAEAIGRLARNRDLCERLARGGRQAYETHLSAAVMARKLDEGLRLLLPGAAPG